MANTESYRLTAKGRVIAAVCELMGWPVSKAEAWYATANPLLGGSTPDLMVRCGREHKVLQFIQAAKDEYGGPDHD